MYIYIYSGQNSGQNIRLYHQKSDKISAFRFFYTCIGLYFKTCISQQSHLVSSHTYHI